jgi:hypothetical protein
MPNRFVLGAACGLAVGSIIAAAATVAAKNRSLSGLLNRPYYANMNVSGQTHEHHIVGDGTSTTISVKAIGADVKCVFWEYSFDVNGNGTKVVHSSQQGKTCAFVTTTKGSLFVNVSTAGANSVYEISSN